MPYSISMQGGRHCVMKENSDGSKSVVKCHPTHGAALAHQRALTTATQHMTELAESTELAGAVEARERVQGREMREGSTYPTYDASVTKSVEVPKGEMIVRLKDQIRIWEAR